VLLEYKALVDAENGLGQLVRYWERLRHAVGLWIRGAFEAFHSAQGLARALGRHGRGPEFWDEVASNAARGIGLLVLVCDGVDDKLRSFTAGVQDRSLSADRTRWPPFAVVHQDANDRLCRTASDSAHAAVSDAARNAELPLSLRLGRTRAPPAARQAGVKVLVEHHDWSPARIALRYGRSVRTIERDIKLLVASGRASPRPSGVEQSRCPGCGEPSVVRVCRGCAALARRDLLVTSDYLDLSDREAAVRLDALDSERTITDETVRRDRSALVDAGRLSSRACEARVGHDERIIELAREGHTIPAIADLIDDTPTHVQTRITALRGQGVQIPYRQTDPDRVANAFARYECATRAWETAAPTDRRLLHRQVTKAARRITAVLALESTLANRLRAILNHRPVTVREAADLSSDSPTNIDRAFRRLRLQGEVTVIRINGEGRNVWGLIDR
jgi:hypothetical protein